MNLPEFDGFWSYGDPAGSERRFRELLPVARAAGDVPYLAELLTQIARAEGLQRRFDAAHLTLDEVEALLPVAGDRATIRYHLERGRAFNSSNRADEAHSHFLSAFRRAQGAGHDDLAVDAAHMLAIVSPADQALSWSNEAIDLARQSADPRAQGWLGSLYNNLGWTYHDLGRYHDALATFQRGLEWQQQAGRAEETRIAAWTVARALRSLGRYEEALERQQENARRLAEIGSPGGFVQEELGECLLALGREVEARPHFARAFDLLSRDQWLRESEPNRLARLERLARAPE